MIASTVPFFFSTFDNTIFSEELTFTSSFPHFLSRSYRWGFIYYQTTLTALVKVTSYFPRLNPMATFQFSTYLKVFVTVDYSFFASFSYQDTNSFGSSFTSPLARLFFASSFSSPWPLNFIGLQGSILAPPPLFLSIELFSHKALNIIIS